MADRSIKYPLGILEDIPLKVGKFFIPCDFVVLDIEEDCHIPIILGRPFLATAGAIIDVKNGRLSLNVGDETVKFNLTHTLKNPFLSTCCRVELTDDDDVFDLPNSMSPHDPLEACLVDDNTCEVDEKYEIASPKISDENSHANLTQTTVEILALEDDQSNEEQRTKVELKPLPINLRYEFLDVNKELPVIVSATLNDDETEKLLNLLRRYRKVIGYRIEDIKGIHLSLCTHQIILENDHKPTIEHQRRLNPNLNEVVKKEVLKLLDSGIIYPISDSRWVSPIQVVPKKGGMTVIKNDKDELISTRTTTGWRMCIDYRKLNKATRKDHFLLPFIDQMLERLVRHTHFCYLDRYSGFFQIPIHPDDQEKTTFTCPYGTFAYRRMPFGLCNAPATFQRCMMAIFSEFIEDIMEVFMDDFLVGGMYFDACLVNLEKVLKKCCEVDLILN